MIPPHTQLSAAPDVLAFRDRAEAACVAIERHAEYPLGAFLAKLEPTLVALYAAALALPDVEPATVRQLPTAVSHDARMELYRALNEKLGEHAFYWEAFDPWGGAGDNFLQAGLGDDLADIHHDLRKGLAAWDPTDAERLADVVWHWRFGFQTHWGQHLADGLRALHWLRHVHHVDALDEP